MKYDRIILAQNAKQYGYVIDTFEKVARLVDILKYIFEHPILKKLFALKGGTAINLFFMNFPRLSVDIDLDYMINDALLDTKRNREIVKRIILSFIESNDYELHKRSKYNHNLDSYVLSYMNSSGNRDIIKIEINYSLRSHILSPVEMALKLEMFSMETKVVLLDPIEIYASKINALCSRAAARDLYDVDTMITSNFIKDTEMLKKMCGILCNIIK